MYICSFVGKLVRLVIFFITNIQTFLNLLLLVRRLESCSYINLSLLFK